MLKLGFVHGYALNGSGSNHYTREMVARLCQRVEVHLFCQERVGPFPAYCSWLVDYTPDGEVAAKRRIGDGNVVVHRPALGQTLPVYNFDKYPGFDQVITFLDLPDEHLEAYVASNAAAIRRVQAEHQLDVIHVNHVLALAEAVRRVSAESDLPFAVMPHGSAIEYVVKKQERYRQLAGRSISKAKGLLLGSEEMGDRLRELWPEVPNLARRFRSSTTGVDLTRFAASADFAYQPERSKSGNSREAMNRLYDAARNASDDSTLLSDCERARDTVDNNQPDADNVEKFIGINWGAPVIAFAGKQIVGKGIHGLLAAFCGILDHHPNAQLVLCGQGPFREALELLVRSLHRGNHGLFQRIVDLGWRFESKPQRSLVHIEHCCEPSEFERLSGLASKYQLESKVHFLGFVSHTCVAQVLARARVAVLPSIVQEAYPLALMEMVAAGHRPITTDHGGAARFLDTYGHALELERSLMAVNPGKKLVPDLERVLSQRLAQPKDSNIARRVAEEHFGWDGVVSQVVPTYQELAHGGVSTSA